MRKTTTVIVFFLSLLFVSSCCNDDDDTSQTNNDCEFVQIDENMDGLIDEIERSIMNTCLQNPLLTAVDVENNLIGEWKLIGHGEGWIPTISQPCAYIVIKQDELILKFSNAIMDTTISTTWEIEEVNWSGGVFFRLKTSPENIEGLFISHFCNNFMFGDATPSDGNMHLYEKIR